MVEDSMTTMCRQEIDAVLKEYDISGVVTLMTRTGGSSFWSFSQYLSDLVQSESQRHIAVRAYYGMALVMFLDECLEQLGVTRADVQMAIESKMMEHLRGEE